MGKKVKKPKLKTKKQCVDLAKKMCRERLDNCEKCGMTRDSGKQMHSAHVIPEEVNGTAADPYNIITLCVNCHKYGNYKEGRPAMHQHPCDFAEWFFAKFPGRWECLKERAATVKPDWDLLWHDLQSRRKKGLLY